MAFDEYPSTVEQASNVFDEPFLQEEMEKLMKLARDMGATRLKVSRKEIEIIFADPKKESVDAP